MTEGEERSNLGSVPSPAVWQEPATSPRQGEECKWRAPYRALKTAPKIMIPSAGSDTITVPPASATTVLIR